MKHVFRGLLIAACAASAASAVTVRVAVTAASADPITNVCPATPPLASNFSTTATSVFLYFILDNVKAGDVVTAVWKDPGGTVYAPAGATWNLAAAGNFCFETKMDVAGQAPASLAGNWTVQIADNQTPLATLPFTISTVSITQVDNSRCPSVTLTVSVVDGSGNSVSGLTAGNFNLKEDGQSRAITVTQIGGNGLSVALLLDTSLSTGSVRSQIATAAKTFVGMLAPTTAVAVYSFSTTTTLLQNFTTDHTALNNAIDSITLITGGGSTAIFDAVVVGSDALAARAGRRALVLLSDGDDNASTNTAGSAVTRANQDGVTVYSVGFYSTDRNDAVLSQLAVGTGGIYVPANSGNTDLQSIFQSLGQLLSRIQYLITYTTVDRMASHNVTLTATQGSATSAPIVQSISACCAVSSSGGGNPDAAPPFGSFDTPVSNTSSVVGAIPVTGWALDDVGVTKVEIYRDPIGSEARGNFGLVYIGNATFVRGARPDVQSSYSSYPNADRAGWGYMLLTNFLPSGGNGTFRLHAMAFDAAANVTELGAPGKLIVCDNAHAAKPFGTIDTPDQGATATGTHYVNFGWALTPGAAKIPIDGSTITVMVDGQSLGHPTYNQYRTDIATLFPTYTNSQGAIGYFFLDTSQFPGCTHTISWVVYDNASRGEGIGSRFFTIGSAAPAAAPPPEEPVENDGVKLRRGFDVQELARDPRGDFAIETEELGRLELQTGALRGYVLVGDQRQDLPAGSSLRRGVFYWQLGPGFIGEYRLVFVRANGEEVPVRVNVRAKSQ